MGAFDVTFSRDALNDAGKLDHSDFAVLREAIQKKLTTNPEHFGKPLRYSLTGSRSLRVGDWRVEFVIRKNTVHVAGIFHRKKGYSR